MSLRNGASTDTKAFRKLYADLCKAWESEKASKAAPFYSKKAGLVFYDFAPLKYMGWKEYANGVQKAFFDNMVPHSSRVTVHNDFMVRQWGKVAVTSATIHLYAKLKDGTKIDEDGRHTAVWEKTGSKWLITHDHWSFPFSAK